MFFEAALLGTAFLGRAYHQDEYINRCAENEKKSRKQEPVLRRGHTKILHRMRTRIAHVGARRGYTAKAEGQLLMRSVRRHRVLSRRRTRLPSIEDAAYANSLHRRASVG